MSFDWLLPLTFLLIVVAGVCFALAEIHGQHTHSEIADLRERMRVGEAP